MTSRRLGLRPQDGSPADTWVSVPDHADDPYIHERFTLRYDIDGRLATHCSRSTLSTPPHAIT